jgi:hypothetical protein
MNRLTMALICVGLLGASESASAQRVKQRGRAIVEYSSPQVKAVAAYEYSHRNHSGPWVLVELAVQARERIAIERAQISLRTPDERIVPLAAQQQFLEDHETINQLLQNATIWRRPLSPYFAVRPQPTIRFFSHPGRIVHNLFVSNLDQVASGDLFFKSQGSGWPAGRYHLTISHPDAQADLPIELD